MEIEAFIDSRRFSRYQLFIAMLCFAIVVIDGFDNIVIGQAAPVLATLWGAPKSAFGPVFGAGLFGMMVGAFGLGPIADCKGRKAVLIVCTIMFSLFSLATVWVDSINELIALRFVAGLGLGGAVPCAIALTSEFCPRRNRALLVAILTCGTPLGGMLTGIVAVRDARLWMEGHVHPWWRVAIAVPILDVYLAAGFGQIHGAARRSAGHYRAHPQEGVTRRGSDEHALCLAGSVSRDARPGWIAIRWWRLEGHGVAVGYKFVQPARDLFLYQLASDACDGAPCRRRGRARFRT
jgi:MFS family permease